MDDFYHTKRLSDSDQPPAPVHLPGNKLPGKLSGFEQVITRHPNTFGLPVVRAVDALANVELAQDLEPIALADLLKVYAFNKHGWLFRCFCL